ncbi:MAG: ORC-CDC6 family AAA ATPase [bacterium]
MTRELQNPFDLVKATDLSVDQIADYFVDFPAGASLIERIKPTSPMPMFILGGKGSGKTHLMRYLSYELKKLRYETGPDRRAGLMNEGYLGIYLRCSGLNAQRFSGKGQSEEIWQSVFAYHSELWFAQHTLLTILDLFADSPQIGAPQVALDATRLLDIRGDTGTTLNEFARYLESLQRATDAAINNCALTRRLEVEIRATPGKLVFGLPATLVRHLPELQPMRFLYLLDEFENLPTQHQRYINTLVRERQDPCSFKVGVRLYGFRTKETLGTQEENREGSEYEALRLDAELRDRREEDLLKFARDLVGKRLVQTGYWNNDTVANSDPSQWLDADQPDIKALEKRYTNRERPYLDGLRRKLLRGLRSGAAPGIRSGNDIETVIEALRYPDDMLLERTSVFLLYRAWAHDEDLKRAAREINDDAHQYAFEHETTRHGQVLKHFRADITAQLLRETRQKQRYLGFEVFVKMSAGLPRALLTIMKNVFTWSLFYGERPFRNGKISARAQTEGLEEASGWFFTDARAPGRSGMFVRSAMTRLGQLLRDIRFSDKPSECSLSTFSADLTATTENALKVLEEAENWSMLIKVAGGQHDRNLGRVDEKYQVHPMLAPRWDLPIARRGALALSGAEASAIFAPESSEDFDEVLKRRVAAMTAPFFGEAPSTETTLLPGLSDE